MKKQLTLLFALVLSMGSVHAQYTVSIHGQIIAVQQPIPSGEVITVQTVQGTQPVLSDTINVSAGIVGLFSKTLLLNSPIGYLHFTSTDCNNTPLSWTMQYQATAGVDTILIIMDYCGAGLTDCLGIPNGLISLGFPCDDGDPNTSNDVFDANCLCNGTSPLADCLGVIGGTDLPGTPCDDGNPNTLLDCWDGSCTCVGGSASACDATFIFYQSNDSIGQPIYGSLFMTPLILNPTGLSYSWDMGDGSTYTQPVFTHSYSGNGPYEVCLTLSGNGCTDMFCDTLRLDTNGLIIPGQSGVGFSVTIQSNGVNSVFQEEHSDLSIFPNPSNGSIYLAGELLPNDKVELFNINGDLILSEKLGSARTVDLQAVDNGVYLLRITSKNGTTTHARVVRQ